MILEIPLQAIPNQKLTVVVNKQQLTIDILLRGDKLYATVYLGANLIISGMPCNNRVYLNQYPTALVGYLYFNTADGKEPVYTELGSNAKLYYSDVVQLASE